MSVSHLAVLLAIAPLLAMAGRLPTQPQRVRKEIRSLSHDEYRLFVQGLSVMMMLSTEAGQQLYGPKYRNYDHFVVKHAVAVRDPRGDQGHQGPCFMTFHRAFLLEAEEALLSVVPALKALPYWDITLDMKGGMYHNTSESMFSAKYAGSIQGDPKNRYQVRDGVFAWRKVSLFNQAVYGQYAHIYNGSKTTGLLRGVTSATDTPYITRYSVEFSAPFISTIGANYSNYTQLWSNNLQLALESNYSKADYERCFNSRIYTTWLEWTNCIDFTSFIFNSQPSAAMVAKYTTNLSPLLHAMAHVIVGGMLSTPDQGGDLFDLATSPNEAMLFLPHHANLDRNAMHWQLDAVKHDPTVASENVMWRYAKNESDLPESWVMQPGCYLHDVVSSNFPFTSIFKKPPKGTGYTHFEVLDYTRPLDNAPYVYDDMLL